MTQNKEPIDPMGGNASISDQLREQEMQGEQAEYIENAVTIIPQSAALIKMENETIMAAAIARPRAMSEVCKYVESEIIPQNAEEMIYGIPYKSNKQVRGKWIKSVTMVRGLSIRAAELVARAMQYVSVSARYLVDDPESCTVVGVAIDLQRGVKMESSPRSFTRTRSKRGGGSYSLNEEKWTQLKASEASKAKRQALMALTPTAVSQQIWISAEKHIAGGDNWQTTRLPKLIESFENMGVSYDALCNWAEKPLNQISGSRFVVLIGLYKAIVDDQVTPNDAFPDNTPSDYSKPNGSVTTDSMLGKEKEDPPAPKDMIHRAIEEHPGIEVEEIIARCEEIAGTDLSAPSLKTMITKAVKAGTYKLDDGRHYIAVEETSQTEFDPKDF